MHADTPIKIKVPRQDLETLSLFQPTVDAAREWAAELPVAHTRAVAQQLLEAITELNRYKLSPEQRFNILEALEPNLIITLRSLLRRFMNHPLVMSDQPRQMAALTDSIFSEVITAYSIVAIETLQQRDAVRETNPAKLVCQSIQRALYFGGRKILLSFLLYQPVELKGWLILHQLYALAERQGLAKLPVLDPASKNTSITNTYLQVLMLGCCKPNQLRQGDLAAVFCALGPWSEDLSLSSANSAPGLFLVDLDSDQPPLYSALYDSHDGPQYRHIDTSRLITRLEKLREKDDAQGKPGIVLDEDTTLPSNMLAHLADALGKMSMRNFARVGSDTPLAVSIGLSSAHFHAAGNRSFAQLLYGSDYMPAPSDRVATNPFLQAGESEHDIWSKANPEEDFVREQAATEGEDLLAHRVELDEQTQAAIEEYGPNPPPERHFPVYEVQMANASPGGYCLDWTADLPGDIKTGDIVSVKEEEHGDWVIAVIRWVSKLEDSRTLLGLELLSPRAMPYGAQIHQKTGKKSEPQRVLLLPEIKLVGQPHTLITPRAGFRERQKITLIREGERFYIQLLRQIAATGSYAQFDFRYIKKLGDVMAEDKSGPLNTSYDSVWSNI